MSTTAGPIVPVLIGSSADLPSKLRLADLWDAAFKVAEVSFITRLPRHGLSYLQNDYRYAAVPTSQTKAAASSFSGLLRVFIAERLGAFVVGEEFAVAAEVDDRAQRPFRIVFGHIIFQLLAEADGGRPVARPFVEHTLDMGGKRDIRQQLLAENLLSLVDVHVHEPAAERGELDIGLLEFGELAQLQRFAEREQVVDLVAERIRKMGQVGLPLVGRRGDLLEHAGERVGRNERQRKGEASGRRLARGRPGRIRPLGHERIDAVDERASA